jgi:hypothetical protein
MKKENETNQANSEEMRHRRRWPNGPRRTFDIVLVWPGKKKKPVVVAQKKTAPNQPNYSAACKQSNHRPPPEESSRPCQLLWRTSTSKPCCPREALTPVPAAGTTRYSLKIVNRPATGF